MNNENVEIQVKKFNEYEAAIAVVKPHLELNINGIEDKEGAKVVRAARIECKKLISKIEADRKSIKAPFLEACKTIDSKANEFKESVQEIKEHLENEELVIASELQKIEEELQAKIKIEVQRRIDLILTCNTLFTGFSYQVGDVQIMLTEIDDLSADEFDSKFSEMQAADNDLKEAEKTKAEKEEKERKAQMEREAELEAKQKEIELKEREAEKREAALKAKEEAAEIAEALRLKNEAKAKEEAKEQKAKDEQVEKDKQAAIIKAKEDERKRIEQEAADKKAAAEREARLAPDKEKLNVLADLILNISVPEMTTKEGKDAIIRIEEQITKMNLWLCEVANKL